MNNVYIVQEFIGSGYTRGHIATQFQIAEWNNIRAFTEEQEASSLWLLTRVRKTEEQPETYKYTEKSTFGVLEGVVTIVEK